MEELKQAEMVRKQLVEEESVRMEEENRRAALQAQRETEFAEGRRERARLHLKELERRHERQNAEATRFAEIEDEQRRTALLTTRAQATLDMQRSVAGEEERVLEWRETIATQGMQKRAAI
ncbi:hypothetical protein OEA41_002264 [Lepraria neglecta]|uniref:Uncharacterized protein n=1 Tax=Lepraria neglecta TaxID=209136 RepID=A0AAD9ZEI7_9LECA|nr:hypothetical protein OEA41_002264 [Lepraria neglecta]